MGEDLFRLTQNLSNTRNNVLDTWDRRESYLYPKNPNKLNGDGLLAGRADFAGFPNFWWIVFYILVKNQRSIIYSILCFCQSVTLAWATMFRKKLTKLSHFLGRKLFGKSGHPVRLRLPFYRFKSFFNIGEIFDLQDRNRETMIGETYPKSRHPASQILS
jgi:hypothetical protein